MPDIAICYWGISRSTKQVYKSHYDKLFNVLNEAGMTYDTYFHTWDVKVNIIWNDISPVPPDPEEYKLLNPTEYIKDNQDEFLGSLTFGDYFHQDAWNRYGDTRAPGGEWPPQLIRNHLCSLESLKRVTKMAVASNKAYKFIVYVRPDVELNDVFPVSIFSKLGSRDIAIPNFDHGEGYNDRGAVMRFEDCGFYAYRLDEIKEFRRYCGRIVSEKYMKYIVDKYYKFIPLEFRFDIIRPKA